MAAAKMNEDLNAKQMGPPDPPSYDTALLENYQPASDKSLHAPTAPVFNPTTQVQNQGMHVAGQPMYNQPLMVGTPQNIMTTGACTHPNMLFNSNYDCCALACIIILIVEFFPFGLYALCCLNGIKRYSCIHCGHVQEQSKKCLYITFGILQVVFVIMFILYFIFGGPSIESIMQSTDYN